MFGFSVIMSWPSFFCFVNCFHALGVDVNISKASKMCFGIGPRIKTPNNHYPQFKTMSQQSCTD